MSTFDRRGWITAALVAAGAACTPHAPGRSPSPESSERVPAAPARQASAVQRLRGVVIVGKDGFGFTPCGSDLQQIASFAPQAQVRIDLYLDQGGALEFFLEGQATVEDGGLKVNTADRIDDDTRECERGEGV